MASQTSFTPHTLGSIELTNRIVMSPMTRSRALHNIPNKLMAEYYAQRAAAGLIITEGTSPSPNGLGYARIPGIFSTEQITGWKLVTDAVHAKGGKIFVQLMHSGRVGHTLNLPKGATLLAPSDITAPGEIWTDQEGMLNHSKALGMTADQLQETKREFVQAAKNAITAGFDGVELHAANGYLLEQFLSPHTNKRTDEYGGGIENRSRFVLEIAQAVSDAIGKEKTGIRISPFGVANDMPHYPGIDVAYAYLAEELNKIGLAYIHLLDHSAMGAPAVPLAIKKNIREKFTNTLILAGGYNLDSAEEHLSTGFANLISFGRPFITNPDLVERFKKKLPLNIQLDSSTLYSADAKGYTDYPVFDEELVNA